MTPLAQHPVRPSPLFVTLVQIALQLLPAPGHAQVLDSASVVTIVRRLENDWAAALIAQDTAKLREILSPQFALVSSENADRPQTRDAWLAAQRPPQTSAFSMRNVVVRVLARRPPWHRYPDLAIASFAAEVRGTAQREQAGTMFVTDIWRLDGNRWRVVARYTSRPQVPSVAAAPKRR